MSKQFKGFDAFKLSDEKVRLIVDLSVNHTHQRNINRTLFKRVLLGGLAVLILLITTLILKHNIGNTPPEVAKPGGIIPDVTRPEIPIQPEMPIDKVQLALIKNRNQDSLASIHLEEIVQASSGGFGMPGHSTHTYGESFENPTIYKYDMLTKDQVKARIDAIFYTLTNQRFKMCELESKEATSDCLYYESESDQAEVDGLPYGYNLSLSYHTLFISVNTFNEVSISFNLDETFDISNEESYIQVVKQLSNTYLGALINLDEFSFDQYHYESEGLRIRSVDKYASFSLARFSVYNDEINESSQFSVNLVTNVETYDIDSVISETQARELLYQGAYIQNTSVVNFLKRNLSDGIVIKEILNVDTVVTNCGVLEYAVPMYRYHVYIEKGDTFLEDENYIVELYVPAVPTS